MSKEYILQEKWQPAKKKNSEKILDIITVKNLIRLKALWIFNDFLNSFLLS